MSSSDPGSICRLSAQSAMFTVSWVLWGQTPRLPKRAYVANFSSDIFCSKESQIKTLTRIFFQRIIFTTLCLDGLNESNDSNGFDTVESYLLDLVAIF